MTQLKFAFTASLLLFMAMNCTSQHSHPGKSSVLGTFVASTPCSMVSRPLPGIPANTDCEFIKWKLTLYQDESTKNPTAYELHSSYGLSKPGTTGFMGGGKKLDMTGKWTIIKAMPSARHAIVYQLKDGKTGKTISFLKLNDNLLHLLDDDQRLMIGSAAWSYTLNRIDNK